jgi:hypothetical protein
MDQRTVAARLEQLGVSGVLLRMAREGQLLDVRREMPHCYYFKGRATFDAKQHPPTPWAPSADHYPILKMAGGKLTPDNVRLGHVMCNRQDYTLRILVKRLLNDGHSMEGIAEHLNARKTVVPHGRNTWSAATVRKAYVS